MNTILVFLGAMIGAPARYLIDRAVQARHQSLFPWGTLSVNVAGCLILGGLAGAGLAASTALFALLGTGFCGALTTYSTFSYETLRLLENRKYFPAAANVILSVSVGIGAAALGYAVLHALAN